MEALVIAGLVIIALASTIWFMKTELDREKPKRTRKRKELKCLTCGEVDPKKFYSQRRTQCKKCQLEDQRRKYKLEKEKNHEK